MVKQRIENMNFRDFLKNGEEMPETPAIPQDDTGVDETPDVPESGDEPETPEETETPED